VTDYQRELAYTLNKPEGKTVTLEAPNTCVNGVKQTRI